MRIAGGALAFLLLSFILHSKAVAQIGDPMPPPGWIGQPAPSGPAPTVKNSPLRAGKRHCGAARNRKCGSQ
jgi:hypothetical protein